MDQSCYREPSFHTPPNNNDLLDKLGPPGDEPPYDGEPDNNLDDNK